MTLATIRLYEKGAFDCAGAEDAPRPLRMTRFEGLRFGRRLQ